MLIALVEKIVQKRNPSFKLDTALSLGLILEFVAQQFLNLARAYKLLLSFRNPKKALLGKNVTFFNLKKIQFGEYMKLGDHVKLSALGTEGIRIGNNFSLGDFGRVVVSTSLNNLGKSIQIGNNVGIGEFAYLGGAGGLEIGDDCIVGQYFSCHPENHVFTDLETPIRLQGVTRKGIKINNNCWIGSKVSILDGVEIGDSCIIAAGAVVTKSFPKNSVIGGVPARLIKNRNN